MGRTVVMLGCAIMAGALALAGGVPVMLQDRHELILQQQEARVVDSEGISHHQQHHPRHHLSRPARHWAEKKAGVMARAATMLEAAPAASSTGAAADETVSVLPPKEHFISEVFYINLDSRTDRRDAMESMLSGQAELPVHRMPAIETDMTTAKNDDRFKKFIGHRKINPYLVDKATEKVRNFVVSVNLAHMLTWEKALATHTQSLDKPVLVLEDDVSLAKGWEDAIESAVAKVPDDYDLIRFSTWGETRPEDQVEDREGVFKAVAPFRDAEGRMFYVGMHAVLIRPRSIPKVMKYLESVPIDDIDASVTTFGNDLKSYVVQDDHISVSDMGAVSNHPYVSNERAALF